MINIQGLDKAEVLLGLYNRSHQQGMGVFQPKMRLTVEDARALLRQTTYFDYLYGKVMKVDLRSDESFDERLYDRDLGEGAAQSVVDRIRENMNSKKEDSSSESMEKVVSSKKSVYHKNTNKKLD